MSQKTTKWTCDKYGAVRETKTEMPPPNWVDDVEIVPQGEIDAMITTRYCDKCDAARRK